MKQNFNTTIKYEQKKKSAILVRLEKIITFSNEIEFDHKNYQQNSIYPFMIALAKLIVLVNVPDSDPAIGFITDCQSTPAAIFFVLLFW